LLQANALTEEAASKITKQERLLFAKPEKITPHLNGFHAPELTMIQQSLTVHQEGLRVREYAAEFI
jgi:hypothetical protein